MRNPETALARAAWCLGALLALVLLSRPAPAQASVVQIQDDQVQVESWIPLPQAMRPGWVPVSLRLTNQDQVAAERVLEFSSGTDWSLQVLSRRPVRLGPGESQELNLLVPYFDDRAFGESIALSLLGGGDRTRTEVHQVESVSANEDAIPALVLTTDPNALDRVREARLGDPTSPTRRLNLVATALPATDLPTDWRGYSTLGLIAIDLASPLPEGAALEAMLHWASLGGSLVLFGEAQELGEQALAAAGFSVDARQVSSERDGARCFRLGFGRVALLSPASSLPTRPGQRGALDLAVLDSPPRGIFSETFQNSPPMLPGVGIPPLSLLAGLLIIFALAMGPILFQLLRRRGAKPWRFLQIAPLLSLGFTVLVLGIGLFSNGIGVRESVQSVSWLDQGRRSVSTIASRTSYSGSLVSLKQRYGADALMIPSRFAFAGVNQARFQVDLRDGVSLGKGFLPNRTPTSSTLVARQSARGGLRLEREGEQLYARNDLDFPLRALRVVDRQGTSYTPDPASATLAPGERVALQARDQLFDVGLRAATAGPPIEIDYGLTLTEDREQIWRSASLPHLPPALPRGSWMAELDRSPFLPDGGISRREDHAVHLLIGQFAAEAGS